MMNFGWFRNISKRFVGMIHRIINQQSKNGLQKNIYKIKISKSEGQVQQNDFDVMRWLFVVVKISWLTYLWNKRVELDFGRITLEFIRNPIARHKRNTSTFHTQIHKQFTEFLCIVVYKIQLFFPSCHHFHSYYSHFFTLRFRVFHTHLSKF